MKNVEINEWPFADRKDVAVFTTAEVLEGEEVVYVSHSESDGAWTFLSPAGFSMERSKVVSLNLIASRYPEVCELADLPLGWKAYRVPDQEGWVRVKNV